MDIQYQATNNLCFLDSNGSIDITVVNLTTAEANLFVPYTIQWFGDIEDATLSNNKRILTNLKNGTYSFRLINSSNSNIVSDLYTINITSPDELIIDRIYHAEASCGGDGYIQIFIDGGIAPYTYSIIYQTSVSSNTNFKFENLEPGTYSISVTDANGCVVTSQDIGIIDSTIDFDIDQIISPTKLDSNGGISFNITGYGPFGLSFESISNNSIINFDAFDTTNLLSINENTYNYIINSLSPGEYNLSIKDRNGCVFVENVEIPNIDPVVVNINVSTDTTQNVFAINGTLPIFDTLLIPYKFIVNNSIEWQTIKQYNIKNHLPIIIDGNIYNFLISRTMLNKYCLEDNKIEVLKLGNTDKDWFFYLQLAPAINLSNNPEFINATIELKTNEANVPITLGLNEHQQIDSNNISLIRGSFIISGLVDAQFKENNNCYISTTDTISDPNEYNFIVSNIKASVHRNLYSAGLVTIINFLENFKNLISIVSLNQNFCDLTIEEYKYLLSIKDLLITLNNFNYINDIYVYSVNNNGNGSLILSTKSQKEFYLLNETVQNETLINYYYFNDQSKNLSDIFINNRIAENILSLYNIKTGFYIIRVRDKYNNTPYNITYNNKTISYNTHAISAKQYIQQYNSNILPFFQDGDILAYVPKSSTDTTMLSLVNIPTTPSINTNISILPINETPLQTISQTLDITNNSSLTIKISPNFTKCVIQGPNNYLLEIDKDTKLINMIPGVYIITGKVEDLVSKNLYENYYRILIDNNNDYTINIKFESYQDKVLIKE